MKIGQTLELAVWLTGAESEGMLRQWKADCAHVMQRSGGADRLLELSPVRFVIKRPGEDRVPPVPDHVKGPDVRLLIAEADVIGFTSPKAVPSFIDELDKRDLKRLRALTREGARQSGMVAFSDEACDMVIRELGPVAAARALKAGVDQRAVQ